MKLTRLSDIRRRELRRAAFEVLQEQGMAGATLEKVAAHAGASKGIVLHYFRNKQELFEHAMREANAGLGAAVAARLARTPDPRARISAVIECNFEPRFFQPSICHAWLSLCAEVPRDATLARIQRVIHARMRSNLVSALRALVPPEAVEGLALGISALIDGYWLRLGLRAGSVTGDDAVRQINLYVDAMIDASRARPVATALAR
ncbi:MAG: transcriptional regulator BetI [Mesorhizobium sp.]|nr:transcriptional regulator BetI [Mesorhizobium sp.]